VSGIAIAHPGQPSATREPMRELAWFLALAFAVSWAVGLTGVLTLGVLGLGLGALCPGLVALALTRRFRGSARPLWRQIVRWRIGWRWYAVALLAPAAVVSAAYAAVLAVGGAWEPETAPTLAAVPIFLALAVVLNGGPEEPGWRGYALPRLQVRFSALTATLLLGAIWAVWHAPLWFVPDLPFADMSYPAYATQIVGMSLVYTWLYNSTSGSVLAVMVLHAAQNTAQQYVPSSLLAEVVMAGLWVALGLALLARFGADSLASTPRVDPETAEQAAAPRASTA
jgi:uncharacterized protein